MNRKRYKLSKRGNALISVGLIVLIIIFAITFLVYYQVNTIIETVRQDLFYVANNAILSFDLKDLSYKQYTVNENKTKQVIEEILNRNYSSTNGSITKIEITNLKIIENKDKVEVNMSVKVKFRMIINILGKNEHEFTINENITISLMDYRKRESYE